MPRTLAAPMVIAVLVPFVLLGAVRLAAPFLARSFQFLEEPRPPEATVTASSTINADEYWTKFSSGTKITLVTLIDINYRSPIDVNDTADIGASVRQGLRTHADTAGATYPDYDSFDGPIKQLKWPITLRLDGSGLEWTEHDIPIKDGTPLPVTKHWVPRAKAAGEYVMRFRLRDINHAAVSHGFASDEGVDTVWDTVKVTVNGVNKDAHGSDDVTLPISIFDTRYPRPMV